MRIVDGGVCAARGFSASGVHCGLRRNPFKKDISLIYSDVRASAAAVYTTNLVKGAPLIVTKSNLKDGMAQAVLCNSGKANTCTSDGIEVAERECILLGKELNIQASDVIVASTGVIGVPLDISIISDGIHDLSKMLSVKGSAAAAEGILTTDTCKKEIAVEFNLGNRICHIGGIAKGSGMVHPNMATILVFLTTDVDISPSMLQHALSGDVLSTFNMVSVDGDTSTNDMVAIMANGLAHNECITTEGDLFDTFMVALNTCTVALCRMIASDGEGATKLLECHVGGAPSVDVARKVAKTVICSNLLKAAMFGADANWGRVLCAIGYSGVDVSIERVDVAFSSSAGKVLTCQNGSGILFSESMAKRVLSEEEIEIQINLNDGEFESRAWGCDLSYDYVRINGDYRT